MPAGDSNVNIFGEAEAGLTEAEMAMPVKQIGLDAFDGEHMESNFEDMEDPFEGENEDGEMQDAEDDSLEGVADPWKHALMLPLVEKFAEGKISSADLSALGSGTFISQKDEDLMDWNPSREERCAMVALDLSGNSVEDLDTLGPTFLRYLSVARNPLASIGGLFHSCRKTLLAIDISGVKVYQLEDCWPVLETLPKLSHLVAADCDIDANQLKKIANDNPLVNVTFANFTNNNIQIRDLDDLSVALPNVEHLILTGNPITSSGVGPLSGHFPGCKIVL